MVETVDHLKQKNVPEADASMEKIEDEFGKAISKLKRSLRQNREEEIESTLRALEERFQKMLKMQLEINKSTSSIAKQKELAELRIKAFQISAEQEKLISETDKTLVVLKEEGSSRAISGTLNNIKLDMVTIAELLKNADVSDETISLQKEVAEVFSELIKSVQQEQDEQSQLKRQSAANGTSEGQVVERPLVQQLAELKIVKQLQKRINQRHLRIIDGINSNSPAEKTKATAQVQELAIRQKRLEKMILDIVQGGER